MDALARIGWLAVGAMMAANSPFASPAHADVFEIGGDGAVTVKAGRSASDDLPDVPANAVTFVADESPARPYGPALAAASETSGLSPTLLAALVAQESGWKADARSPKGAIGLAQLMPDTARALGVNASDPYDNLSGGARYLRSLYDRFGGDLEKSLAAYNAGPGRVVLAGGIPAIPETRKYVAGISARLSAVALKGQ